MKRVRYRRNRCVVIGAGLAGLTAAYHLTRKGWSVTVLETRGGVGGRVFSGRFHQQAPNLVCELGGEWIGRDHHRMLGLCREFKLRTMRHQFAYRFWSLDSAQASRAYPPTVAPFPARARKQLARFERKYRHYSEADKRELDQLDWWSKLRAIGWNDTQLRRRDLMDSTDFGESIRMTSAFAAAGEYFGSNRSDEMDYKIVGGNDLLPTRLAAAITSRGGKLNYNARVTKVDQDASGVAVYLGAGQKPVIRADHCICSVPTQRVLDIHWHPALPLDQHQALMQLRYARIVKTVVLCRQRFWPQGRRYGFSVFTNGVADFCFDATALQRGSMGILCSYSIGDKADDVAYESEQNLANWIVGDVYRMFGKGDVPADMVVDVRRCAWQLPDALTGGAYAFFRPGQAAVQSIFGRPHRRVLFVGEHLADWQGFMEGAVQTGEAAAAML